MERALRAELDDVWGRVDSLRDRLAQIRSILEGVSARGTVTDGRDLADLAAVLLLCGPPNPQNTKPPPGPHA